MNIRGFLRWWLRDCFSNPSFIAFWIVIAGMLLSVLGGSMTWALGLMTTGLVVVLIDGAWVYFRATYRLYQSEQDRIMQELERKE